MVEGWLELGNPHEAELEFQKLPARAINTRRGLALWLQLSLATQRWSEVEASARQLRQAMPWETYPIIHEAEAMHQQGMTINAVALLALQAPRFAGPEWPEYLGRLQGYVAEAGLPEKEAAMFDSVLKTQIESARETSIKVTEESHSTNRLQFIV